MDQDGDHRSADHRRGDIQAPATNGMPEPTKVAKVQMLTRVSQTVVANGASNSRNTGR